MRYSFIASLTTSQSSLAGIFVAVASGKMGLRFPLSWFGYRGSLTRKTQWGHGRFPL